MLTRIRRLLWLSVLSLVLLLGIKTFVIDVYPVVSSSMEPNVHQGEWVAVAFGGDTPGRGDVVVLRLGSEVFVKRVCGLGGERVSVDPSGDLWVNGERVPFLADNLVLVPVFDLVEDDPARWFKGLEGAWVQRADGALEAHAPPLGSATSPAALRLHPILRDSFVELDGTRVEGEVGIHDLVLEAKMELETRRGRVVFAITEQGDRFELRLDLAGTALADPIGVSLVRKTPEVDIPLGAGTVTPASDGTVNVRLGNVDNHLFTQVGEWTAQHDYERNRLHPLDEPHSGQSFGARVWVESHGAGFALSSLRVSRDLQYRARGRLATGGVRVGPGQLLVLGDNSGDSLDGRDFGPIELDAIIGRPVFAFWPPKAVRWIK